jgi:hypothetical protein
MEEKNKLYPNSGQDEIDHFTDKIHIEIAFLIFSFLDLKSLCFSSLVSKHWHQLASDKLLWKEPLKRYSRGHLWRYLFKTPDKSAYQSYFTEVFFLPNFTDDNFFELIKPTKDNLIKHITFSRISERRERFNKHFEQVNIIETKSLPSELIKSIQELSHEVRSQLLIYNWDSILEGQNFKKLIATLHQIDSLETILTNQLYLFKLGFFDPPKLQKLISPAIDFLETNTIIAIMASVGDKIILNSFLLGSQLLKKLNCDELVECATCSEDIAEFILRQSNLINRLTDEELRTIFYKMPNCSMSQTFFEILQDNPRLLNRFTADFMIKLVEYKVAGQFRHIPNLILSHPVLINRLNEDQCVEILAKRQGSLFSSQNIETLNSEAFKRYTLNLNNPRDFLLRLSHYLEDMYDFDWVAEILKVENALRV